MADGGNRSWKTALLLSWLIGWTGADRFYLGYTGLGLAKLLTVGGCFLWWSIDLVMILLNKIPDVDGKPLQ